MAKLFSVVLLALVASAAAWEKPCDSPPPCTTMASPPPCMASPPPCTTMASPPPCASPPPPCMYKSPPPPCVVYNSPPPPCMSSPPPPVQIHYASPPPPCVVYNSPPPPCMSSPPPPVQIHYASPPPPCVVYNSPPPPCTTVSAPPPCTTTVSAPPPCTTTVSAPPPCGTPAPTYKCGTLGLSHSKNLTIFLSLVYACGADVISIWENPSSKFTVMAPVNDAFKGYDIPKLMANKEQVRYLVGAHILYNTWLPDQYSSCNGNEYTTLSSTKCNIYTEGTKTWAQTCKNTATFVNKRWNVCQIQIVPIKSVLKYNDLY